MLRDCSASDCRTFRLQSDQTEALHAEKAEWENCTVWSLSGGHVRLRCESEVSVKDDDVVALIFVEKGPRFTFHTDVFNRYSSSTVCDGVNW